MKAAFFVHIFKGFEYVEPNLVKASRARRSGGRHWRWSWGFVTSIVLIRNLKR
jgi:hypothetical protein